VSLNDGVMGGEAGVMEYWSDGRESWSIGVMEYWSDGE